jgi:hypothetical protein
VAVLAQPTTEPPEPSLQEEQQMLVANFAELNSRMDRKQAALLAAQDLTTEEKQAEMEGYIEHCFSVEGVRKNVSLFQQLPPSWQQPQQLQEEEGAPVNDTNVNKRQPFPPAPLTISLPFTAREIVKATETRTAAFTTFSSSVTASQQTGLVTIKESWSTNNNPDNVEKANIDVWGLVGGGFTLTAPSNTILVTASITRVAPNVLNFHSFNDIDFFAFRSHTTTVDNFLKLHLVKIPGAVSIKRRFSLIEHNSFAGQSDFSSSPTRTAALISPFVECIGNIPAGQYEILIGIENAIATRTDDIRVLGQHTNNYKVNNIRVRVDTLNRQCNPFRGP